MGQAQRIVGLGFFATAVMMFASPTVFGDHLDRYQVRRVVRTVEERLDELQDRVDDWVLDRPDERGHRGEELYHRINRFAAAVDDLKGQLRDRDEPWELREQARAVVDAGRDLGALIESGDWPDDFRHGWHDVHDHLDDLSRMYHLH